MKSMFGKKLIALFFKSMEKQDQRSIGRPQNQLVSVKLASVRVARVNVASAKLASLKLDRINLASGKK